MSTLRTTSEIHAGVLTESEIDELTRLKQYFPYRICYCAKKEGAKTEFYAKSTKHGMKKLLEDGFSIYYAV